MTALEEVRDCLKKAKNIYPPMYYQEFRQSKSTYYRYLREHGVSVLPTLSMTAAEYRKLGHVRAAKTVLGHAQAEGWKKFVAKPEWGQESRDVKFFWPRESVRFDGHVKKCMKKYPGIIFQKCIEGFGQTREEGELRMLYVGGKYQYSFLETDHGDITYSPDMKRDDGLLDMVPVKLLKRHSREVLKKLPRLVMPNGAKVPHLIDRVDMGFRIDGKLCPFVNEIEFCPSYFIRTVSPELGAKLIKNIGHQIVKITKLYTKQSAKQSAFRQNLSPAPSMSRKRSQLYTKQSNFKHNSSPAPSMSKKRKLAD